VLTLLLLDHIALSEIYLAESDALCSLFCCSTSLHCLRYSWQKVTPCAHTFAAQPHCTIRNIFERLCMPCAHTFAVDALCPHVCCGCPVPTHLLWMPCAHTFAVDALCPHICCGCPVPTRLLCPHVCCAHTLAMPTHLLCPHVCCSTFACSHFSTSAVFYVHYTLKLCYGRSHTLCCTAALTRFNVVQPLHSTWFNLRQKYV